jgi:membrane protease YdiL (CAAX protease family)
MPVSVKKIRGLSRRLGLMTKKKKKLDLNAMLAEAGTTLGYPALNMVLPFTAEPLCFLYQRLRGNTYLDLMSYEERQAFLKSSIHPLTVIFWSSVICLAIVIPLNLRHWRIIKFFSSKISLSSAILCLALGISLQLLATGAIRMSNPDEIVYYGASFPLAVFVSGIVAPAAQELMFRANVYESLKYNMHWGFAVVLQAIIYALFRSDFVQAPAALVTGLAFGLAFEWTGSIWAPAIAHFGYGVLGAIIATGDGEYSGYEASLVFPFFLFAALVAMTLAKLRSEGSVNE